jgi:HTH-type transcriptional regulator/antitoxin MqsA
MDHFSRCRACRGTFYAPGELDATLLQASEAIRREEGLLFPENIRKIRERLGLTQSAFEKLLGVGPKTVVRWEKGTVFQNRSTDSLLRLVDALPECGLLLARLHEVSLPDDVQRDLISEAKKPEAHRATIGRP